MFVELNLFFFSFLFDMQFRLINKRLLTVGNGKYGSTSPGQCYSDSEKILHVSYRNGMARQTSNALGRSTPFYKLNSYDYCPKLQFALGALCPVQRNSHSCRRLNGFITDWRSTSETSTYIRVLLLLGGVGNRFLTLKHKRLDSGQ